jgi:hypothetical protein
LLPRARFAPQELEAAQTRQPKVEDERREWLGADGGLRLPPILHPVRHESPLLQPCREGITEQRVVLDNQHTHVAPPSHPGDALDCPRQ